MEQTETVRAEGHYREARSRLLECVNAQCGGDVRRRCASTLQKLDAVTPSIVVRAEDGNGNDVMDVSVSLGDEQLVSQLDGMALPVDPGEHRFVFRRQGYEPVTQTLSIEQGEKFRSIEVKLGQPPPDVPSVRSPARASGMSRARLAAGVSLIGVGVLGVSGFGWLGLKARSDEKDLEACKPTCSEGSVDAVQTRYVLSNVSLGVGVAALGLATWVLLTAPAALPPDRSRLEGWALGATEGGAFAAYSGRF